MLEGCNYYLRMSHYLPLSRVARLVGESRSSIQRRIHDGELQTFDGQIELDELLRVFPDSEILNRALAIAQSMSHPG